MKKAIKFVYWFVMSCLFVALWYRERKIDGLNSIDIER